MNHYQKRIFPTIVTATGFLLSLLMSSAAYTQPAKLQEQRDLFKQAYSDIQEGELIKVKPVLSDLKDYPLYPWLEYEFLASRLDGASDKRLLEFVERYPNTLMSDRIYRGWARRLARTRDWSALLRYIPDSTHLESLNCLRAEALYLTGETDKGLQQGKAIWDSAAKSALPKECDDIITLLERKGLLAASDYWQRIGELIPKNKITAAKSLATKLSEDEKELVSLWAKIRGNPKKYLPDAFEMENSDKLREVVVYGVQRAADKKLSMAKPLWKEAREVFEFTEAETSRVESVLGMWEAWRHDQAGLDRLTAIRDEYRTDTGNAWMARMALRTGQWDELLRAINAMEQQEAERDIWRYWKARALEENGKAGKANTLYTKLAQDTTFYGFLAADRLGQAYARLKEPAPDRSQRIAGLKKVAAIQRWQEWMMQDNRAQARREWFRTLKAMDKEGMLAAAELATQSGDANLAIWTVSRTKDWNIVDLRFPMLYTDLVMEQSRSQGIKPEWIFGVMRRESAFDAGVESHAKALGLMQLMPATARNVGEKLGMKVTGRDDILQPATNVQLGSAYLRDMLSKFRGNYAQATAAYNAGPHRIPKWAPDKTTGADQWIESIPFRETRRYARAVMAYTTIYDHKLNPDKAGRLSMRLKPVSPE